MKRVNYVWTNGRDVCYPMNELNLAHVESSDEGKARPNFSKLTRRFGAKFVSPRVPHGMTECLNPTLV